MPDTLSPVKIVKIKDLIRPDPRNANKHSERGHYMVSESIEQDGMGRSVLLTADGQLIAGELTTETAVERGITEVIVVPNDGTRLVAVQRVDVESGTDRAARLAIFDNRSGEVSLNWDSEMLQALAEDGVDLSAFFYQEELSDLEEMSLRDDTNLAGNGSDERGKRLGEGGCKIKPVLDMARIDLLERAIQATGERNRATAFERILTAFLDSQGLDV